jgi:uncharacterized Ntn-hydrolase superfamily protein
MKSIKMSLVFFLAVVLSFSCHATWSIIVIDPRTNEIGIAGASCTYSVYGIGAIIPGKGAIVVQAMSNKLALVKGLAMIRDNETPEKILATIKEPRYFPEEQQYAIVCINAMNNPLTYTGTSTTSNKGALTARGVSVQGNTLTDAGELQAILDAVIKAQSDSLRIEEVLMLALEAGAKSGGDKRCGERKASSAFLTVAKPGDDLNSPSLNLIVKGDGKDINAVAELRKKFDNRKNK